jgi:tetratricopeptide (TPR) repeat protein
MKIEKIKEQARRHEQQEEWADALSLYSKALERSEEQDEPDIALHNRIGDLQVRIGDLEGAVESYEQAIDLYLEADLANNALAVCRKLERSAPGRTAILLRMGQIRVRQGFLVDARQDFLDYAAAQTAQGDEEEALRALEEFAQLVPTDVEIRVFLAQRLAQQERQDEAERHLRAAFRQLQRQGNREGAAGLQEVAEGVLPGVTLDSAADPPTAAGPTAEPDLTEGDPSGVDEPAQEEDLAGFEATSFAGWELDDPAIEERESDEAEADGSADLHLEELPSLDAPLDLEPPLGPDEVTDLEQEDPSDPLEGTVFDLDFESEPDEESAEDPEPVQAADPLPMLGDEDWDEVAAEEPDDEFDDGFDEEFDDEFEDSTPLPTLDDPTFEDPVPLPEVDRFEFADPAEAVEQPVAEPTEPPAPVSLPTDGAVSLRDRLNELRAKVMEDPDDATGWRGLATVLLEAEMEDEARVALKKSHQAYAEAGDPERAMRVVRELIFLDPDDVAHHQRLVEYAHRTGDRALMVPAYLELADVLERTGASQKAEAVLGQVLALDPRNPRAQKGLIRLTRGADEAPAAQVEDDEPRGEFVDLGGMVLDEATPSTYRWKMADADPSGDEDADFARMLAQFRERVARDLPSDDATPRYDLGAAFKEMGLLDEAITEFQKAIRARPGHLASYEMMGQAFLEKGQPEMAVRSLTRALEADYQVEDELLGIYYYLAQAHEAVGNPESAREFYERVFSLDINFMDVTERLRALR